VPAREESGHDQPSLADEQPAAAHKLRVGNVSIIIQPRITEALDSYHWHMRFEPGSLGRVALLVGLAIWSISLLGAPMDAVLSSFMHTINLPFHEAGHIIFSPFGRFMTILGGSLMQIVVPVVCAGALIAQAGDWFGAAVCAWWLGENLLDLAPYINDARSLNLMLLGGPASEVEGHDWEAILENLGWLRFDHLLANGAHRTGALIMIGSLIWAAVVLARTLGADQDLER
jgi:hypothetical protein